MPERIYLLRKDESEKDEPREIQSLEETPFTYEDDLQALLAEHPELIDGERIRPDDPRRWILVKREKGIAETADAGDRFALDHLLIDQDAIPTLVEVKRRSNTEVRRKVVGQLLEYAAHATGGAGSWAVEDIKRDFETTTKDPADAIAKLLKTNEESDVADFWQKVDDNLAARRIRLLFVADEIPDSLARIVEFLNEQTRDNIEVLAVEIKQFSGQNTQTLVPRVIGRTAAPQSKGKLTHESFLADFTNNKERAATERLLDVASRSGGSLGWNPSSVSLRGVCPLHTRPVPVARIYLPSTGSKSFYFGWVGPSWGYPRELEQRLREWTSQFEDDSFTEVSGTLAHWWATTVSEAANHIDLLANRLAVVLSDLKSLGAGEGT